jgi:hypothetical protein
MAKDNSKQVVWLYLSAMDFGGTYACMQLAQAFSRAAKRSALRHGEGAAGPKERQRCAQQALIRWYDRSSRVAHTCVHSHVWFAGWKSDRWMRRRIGRRDTTGQEKVSPVRAETASWFMPECIHALTYGMAELLHRLKTKRSKSSIYKGERILFLLQIVIFENG